MEKIEDLLREFGLTEYEIKAFITLLKLKIATAEQISDIGAIPLPRVYDTLVELKKKGFVLISKGRPKKFKSVSPEKALDNLIKIKKDDFDRGIDHLKENVRNIKEIIPDMKLEDKPSQGRIEDLFTIWSTEKRKNVRAILDEQKESAKSEILIFSGDISWIEEAASIIRGAIRKGVKIRAIVHEPENEDWKKNIETAKKMGIAIKTGYTGLMRGHVIDGSLVSIATKTSIAGLNVAGEGKPGSDSLNQYELITSDNPIMTKSFKENFEFWWKELK
jgi:sugar-specific transcriptional regulator TrmB